MKKTYAALILNVAIVILEGLGFYSARGLGWEQFCYYTQISNLFLGLISLILVGFLLRYIRDGVSVPAWVSFLKYSATIMTAQTFLVSLFVLSPMMGGVGLLMLGPIVRYFHTLCPLLAIVSFLLVDFKALSFTRQHTLLAMIPTMLYAMVAITLNILRIWHGPYPFLYVYEQPVWASAIWLVVIMGAAYLIAFLLRVIHRRLSHEYVYR